MGVFNFLIIFVALLNCTFAQRPFYAGSGQYPGVLPQNLPNNTEDLGNRFGENSTTPDPYKKDPVYNVEQELVDRIKNEFPRDKQPFWYVNNAQLNAFKNPQQPQQQSQQQLEEQQQQRLQQQRQLNNQQQFQRQQQSQQQQQLLRQYELQQQQQQQKWQSQQYRQKLEQQRLHDEMRRRQQEYLEQQQQKLRI